LRRFVTSALYLLLTLSAALPARAAGQRVVVTTSGPELTLWLPAGAGQGEQEAALGEVARYRQAWGLLAGHDAVLPDLIEVAPGGSLRETLFGTLWRFTNSTVPATERTALWGALRWAVLDDQTPVRTEVERLVADRRMDESFARGPALLTFLSEEVEDGAFLRGALPPGPGAAHLKAALAARGVAWDRLWNRYAAWLLARAVEWGALKPSAGSLPAVWMLDKPLAPSELLGWRIALADPVAGVNLEASGASGQGLRLFHVFTDESGHVLEAGLCDLDQSPLSLPRRGAWLWIFLWNTTAGESGQGAALTLWSSFRAPFSVVSATLRAGTLDLLLRQDPGIADFRVWGHPAGESKQVPLATFPSEGEGDHHYLLPLPASAGSSLRLSCRTLAGGAYSADLPVGDVAP
jgi:hypothetical protein